MCMCMVYKVPLLYTGSMLCVHVYKVLCYVWQDPLLRRSGMFTVAMAYCGSGNNGAIRRLLHVAVSEPLLVVLGVLYKQHVMCVMNL